MPSSFTVIGPVVNGVTFVVAVVTGTPAKVSFAVNVSGTVVIAAGLVIVTGNVSGCATSVLFTLITAVAVTQLDVEITLPIGLASQIVYVIG